MSIFFITPLETGKQMIEVTTLVKYHNWVGKAYFFCIKTFSSGHSAFSSQKKRYAEQAQSRMQLYNEYEK